MDTMTRHEALKIIDSYENSAAIRHRFEYATMHMTEEEDFSDALWEATTHVICSDVEAQNPLI